MQVGTLMYSISYARWATELLFLANANEMHAGLFKVDDTLSSLRYGNAVCLCGCVHQLPTKAHHLRHLPPY